MPWSMKLYNIIRNINFLISQIECFSYNSPPRIYQTLHIMAVRLSQAGKSRVNRPIYFIYKFLISRSGLILVNVYIYI